MSAPRMGLTKRQAEALAYIRGYIADNVVAPSYAELLVGLGLSGRSRAVGLVRALSSRGYITFTPAKARSIALVPDDTTCPQCGHRFKP